MISARRQSARWISGKHSPLVVRWGRASRVTWSLGWLENAVYFVILILATKAFLPFLTGTARDPGEAVDSALNRFVWLCAYGVAVAFAAVWPRSTLRHWGESVR